MLNINLHCSTGFAEHNDGDNVVETENGLKRKLSCGTEKDKHKPKNHKSAGTKFVFLKITSYLPFKP